LHPSYFGFAMDSQEGRQPERRTQETRDGAAPRGRFLSGLAAIGIGLLLVLIGLGLIPIKPSGSDAPPWLTAVAGLAFLLAGISIAVGALNGVSETGELPKDASVAVQKFAILRGVVGSELLNQSHTSKLLTASVPLNPKFANERAAKPSELRIQDTSRRMHLFHYLIAVAIAGGLASIGTWIAFDTGPRAFGGTGMDLLSPEANAMTGRIVFGIGAVLAWLITIVIAISGLRKLLSGKTG
jgi:hypothetical protein